MDSAVLINEGGAGHEALTTHGTLAIGDKALDSWVRKV
jgi:hypothetical protein